MNLSVVKQSSTPEGFGELSKQLDSRVRDREVFMSELEEISKAVQEAARLGPKGFGVVEKAGGFLEKVLGRR